MTPITKATELARYVNGNTVVTILSDGTKIREYEGKPIINHPESIDVKITDYCDMGCQFCHESSTQQGLHGDLDKLLEIISVLSAGVELAIGGGNPLSHPYLINFLVELKSRGFIANITVNQGHLKRYKKMLLDLIARDLVKGVGISVTQNTVENIRPFAEATNNLVFHLIAGVSRIDLLNNLFLLNDVKILLLGYKLFGFGKNFYSQSVVDNLKAWKKVLPSLLERCTISFDNLAIEQLNVKRLLTREAWKKFYMGDDFCFTMYIDAVKQEYAPTSRSDFRVPFSECSLLEFFNKNHLQS